ncbi:DUF4129 domain-containing protein [Kribbella sandramycini]|uniref:DUF4129 domain-containing protein n=1 Tax=Kribbella sandramycini TaxID=60450 RepID=A0A7Y4L7T5_9ACTN|nr:DUF4129 domain-containing protein [Kribbella sandramycini]
MVAVLLLGVAGAGFVVLASAGGSVRPLSDSTLTPKPGPDRSVEVITPPPHPSVTPPPERNQETRETPEWIQGLFEALVYVIAAAVAALIGLLLYRVLRRVKLPDAPPPDPDWERVATEKLAEAIDSGLALIDTGHATDAVIACWVALEQAAASAGVTRDPAETPTEFTVRVLGVEGVSEPDLTRLGALYREARYSTHGSTEESRSEARAALLRLRAELAAVVPE